MKVTINPCALSGTIKAPPSKSMAHRMLICAGLSSGTSTIEGVALSQDVRATIACLRALGAKVEMEGDTVTVTGADPRFSSAAMLPCNESGSTLRFFLPLCLLSGAEKRLVGAPRLIQRPQEIYRRLCEEKDIAFSQTETAITVCGALSPGDFKIDGSVSSQFFSGLLFALPLLDGDSRIYIENRLESRPYLELTRAALAESGVKTVWEGENVLFIPGNQSYAPICGAVEGDWSNAAFFFALATLGHDVKVEGLNEDSGQGDKIVLSYLDSLKKGVDVPLDLSDCPDLAPILFAMAAYYGKGRFVGTDRLKYKESDRIAAMGEELSSFGARLYEGENSVRVENPPLRAPKSLLSGHNDHRIVMALSVLLTLLGGQIDGAEAVRKSMPDFFDVLSSLHAEVEIDAC